MRLKFGRLENYPQNAKNFKTATAGSMFTREFMVSFEANAADIQKWVEKSEGLKGITPDIYTKEHQYFPGFPSDANWLKMLEKELPEAKYDYHPVVPHKPQWLNDLKIKNGRKFQIPGKEGHGIGGILIIDDDTNTVYLDLSWS
ncbi:MAG: hypothetical protein A2X49_08920 [Lentisphaerae bacterium GWF2_52_8]|nr:MAG: hypothetical protein A2X49_08920 [Lentisphaerae bacterium GWF2_52_8]